MSGLSDWLSQTLGMSATVQGRLLGSLIVLVVILVARWLVVHQLGRRIEEPDVVFRARKFTTYAATIVLLLALGRIWIDAFGDLATFLGLVSAGIAIALADVFANLAGWLYIVLRSPFSVGDRVQIGSDMGDVIDVRLFRFSLLEIRNWVDGDQPTGRILHVPNGTLFRQPMANYTQGFRHIWHEVSVLVTFESDWEKMEEMMRDVLAENAVDPEVAMAADDLRRASQQYLIGRRQLDPEVYVSVKDSGVQVTGRLLISARRRRAIDDSLWRSLLRRIAAEPSVELAYPTVRTYLPDVLRLRNDPAEGAG